MFNQTQSTIFNLFLPLLKTGMAWTRKVKTTRLRRMIWAQPPAIFLARPVMPLQSFMHGKHKAIDWSEITGDKNHWYFSLLKKRT